MCSTLLPPSYDDFIHITTTTTLLYIWLIFKVDQLKLLHIVAMFNNSSASRWI